MKTFLIIALALLPVGVSAAEPDIDALVTRLSHQPLWTNGVFPLVRLSAEASPGEVLQQCFLRMSFDTQRVRDYKIRASQQVTIPPESEQQTYVAVVVDTDCGRKIALLRFDAQLGGWWSRVFDAE